MSMEHNSVTYISYNGELGPINPIRLAEASLEIGCHFYPEEWSKIANDGRIPPSSLERACAKYEYLCSLLGSEAVSTCIFVDGYNGKLDSVIEPARAFELLIEGTEEAGIPLHYIGSEGACGGGLAEMVETWLLAEPLPGATGADEPTNEKGWLSNGILDGNLDQYSGGQPHSISLATQFVIRRPPKGGRPGEVLWACPYLAAIWQLARLGLLPEEHIKIGQWAGGSGVSWDNLPLVTQVDAAAPPFPAKITDTILPKKYMITATAECQVLNCVILPEAVFSANPGRVFPEELSELAGYEYTTALRE